MKQTVSLEEIYSPVENKIAKIPEAIFEILSTPNELAQQAIGHFFSAAGKYLRPTLCFFGASIENEKSFSPIQETKLIHLAAAYEVFHSATLIHDDIIDSAHLRRNIPTLNAKWSPQVAVLVGDYLHDKAIGAIFSIENPRIMGLFLHTAGTVCDGEIHEWREKNNFNLTEREYCEIVQKKTASLIACSIESGGIFADLTPEKTGALKRFGEAFGMAFQIVDDCLDFSGQEHEFGKTLGIDFEGGVLTLPLIRLLELVDERTKSEVFKMFKSDFGDTRFGSLKDMIQEYGTLDYSMARAKEFTRKARLELSIFQNSPVRASLDRLLDYVLDRNR